MVQTRHGAGRGPSQRQLKVGELIRRTLSDVLMRGDLHDPELDRFSITVSEATISPDLRHADVYVMPLGGQGVEEVLGLLDRNRHELRRAVTREVKLKYSPNLRFHLDRSFDRMDETRRLLGEDRVREDVARDEGGDGNGGDDGSGRTDPAGGGA